ncbi:MAG: nucleoside triphosphate pyrophosphatase [Planctomycetota bacterium]|nr:nucleoside triphosphate pyrophosphatase [Planctomycetota bacterium]
MNKIPPRLVLASRSPRRKDLLADAGYDFLVLPPESDQEEGPCDGESAAELVERLAEQKALAVAAHLQTAVVVGCDTVVECEGAIMGKPPNVTAAKRMLLQLRGREHRVYSGLCLVEMPGVRKWRGVSVTTLVMDSISDEQLARYLQSGGWAGKAGAFGYQDGLEWLRIVKGSPSNVVGLPLELFSSLLTDAGYVPFDHR